MSQSLMIDGHKVEIDNIEKNQDPNIHSGPTGYPRHTPIGYISMGTQTVPTVVGKVAKMILGMGLNYGDMLKFTVEFNNNINSYCARAEPHFHDKMINGVLGWHRGISIYSASNNSNKLSTDSQNKLPVNNISQENNNQSSGKVNFMNRIDQFLNGIK